MTGSTRQIAITAISMFLSLWLLGFAMDIGLWQAILPGLWLVMINCVFGLAATRPGEKAADRPLEGGTQ